VGVALPALPGLPPPIDLMEVRSLGPKTTHRAVFEPPQPDLMLHRLRWDPGFDLFAHEEAALARVRGKVPCQPSYRQLIVEGRRAALAGVVDGRSGRALLQEDPRRLHGLSRIIGKVMGVLSTLSADRPGWGLGCDESSSWRDTWWAWTQWEVETARACGLEPSPAVVLLLARVGEGLACLDEVEAFAVVHRDLRPSNLMARMEGDRMALRGVIDWSGALLGDSMVEWVLPMSLSERWLRGILAGYGWDRAGALFTPAACRRLELYGCTRALGAVRRAAQMRLHASEGHAFAAAAEAELLCARALRPQSSFDRVWALLGAASS
jgi:hypothetical protein